MGIRPVTDIVDLTADFKKGTLTQRLAMLPDKMEKAGLEAINEGADFMKMMAKNLVLVDTGTLRKSIRKERGGKGRLTVSVRAGGYFVNPKTGKLCNYAHWVEMKYPYMRPAYDMVRPYILRLIRQKVLEAFES